MLWKAINTNPRYEISNTGLIRNAKTKQVRKLKEDKDGYLEINLWNGDKYTYHRVHRLVLENFIGLPTANAPEVHHKDGNRKNNNINNLEWTTRKENDSHVIHKINSGSYQPIMVQQFDLNGNLIGEYESMSEASRQTGCHISKISLVCNGKRYTTGGYVWKKVESSTTNCSKKSYEMENSLKKDEDIV